MLEESALKEEIEKEFENKMKLLYGDRKIYFNLYSYPSKVIIFILLIHFTIGLFLSIYTYAIGIEDSIYFAIGCAVNVAAFFCFKRFLSSRFLVCNGRLFQVYTDSCFKVSLVDIIEEYRVSYSNLEKAIELSSTQKENAISSLYKKRLSLLDQIKKD